MVYIGRPSPGHGRHGIWKNKGDANSKNDCCVKIAGNRDTRGGGQTLLLFKLNVCLVGKCVNICLRGKGVLVDFFPLFECVFSSADE